MVGSCVAALRSASWVSLLRSTRFLCGKLGVRLLFYLGRSSVHGHVHGRSEAGDLSSAKLPFMFIPCTAKPNPLPGAMWVDPAEDMTVVKPLASGHRILRPTQHLLPSDEHFAGPAASSPCAEHSALPATPCAERQSLFRARCLAAARHTLHRDGSISAKHRILHRTRCLTTACRTRHQVPEPNHTRRRPATSPPYTKRSSNPPPNVERPNWLTVLLTAASSLCTRRGPLPCCGAQ